LFGEYCVSLCSQDAAPGHADMAAVSFGRTLIRRGSALARDSFRNFSVTPPTPPMINKRVIHFADRAVKVAGAATSASGSAATIGDAAVEATG